MAIGEICSREVVIVRREESVLEAAQLMRQHHVGCLVVVDDAGGRRRPTGIVTDRDIVVAVVAKAIDPRTLSVADVMSASVHTVAESSGVAETIAIMRDRGVRRLPVVDAQGGLAGIVTADDIADLLAEEMSALARLVKREQQAESVRRTV